MSSRRFTNAAFSSALFVARFRVLTIAGVALFGRKSAFHAEMSCSVARIFA
jgi:hypothetical protein